MEKTLNFKRLISAMLYALLCLLMTSAFIFCAITPAFAADTKVATTGQELQALIDNVSEGGELHIQLDPSGKGEFVDDFILDKTIEITKPCKLYFDGLRLIDPKNGRITLLSIECKNSHAFYVDADNVELHFSGGVQIGGPQSNKTYGEGIYVNGDNCLIDGGRFAFCGDPVNDYDGGAIYVDGRNCTIQDAAFYHCYGYDGGAICVNQHDCHVINCSFAKCRAMDYGGAIYVCTGTYGFVASGCTFSEVEAIDYAHYISGARDAKVYNCSPHWGEEDYYSCWCEFVTSDPIGFTIGSGSIWIIAAGAVVILGGLAAILVVNRKKRKSV